MKDIPVFTTENGVASLTLREIPFQKKAYITLQATQCPEELLQECIQFCTMAGAERVYATGHVCLESRPIYTSVIQMQCLRSKICETDASLFPVQDQTCGDFLRIYNEKVLRIPNAASLSDTQARQIQDGYFVHRNGTLLGVGRASGNRIDFLAAVVPGAGQDVLAALCHALTEETIVLEVASANEKAVALYTRMGFVPTKEIKRWYCVK